MDTTQDAHGHNIATVGGSATITPCRQGKDWPEVADHFIDVAGELTCCVVGVFCIRWLFS